MERARRHICMYVCTGWCERGNKCPFRIRMRDEQWGDAITRSDRDHLGGGHLCTDDDDGLENLQCKSMGKACFFFGRAQSFVYGSHSRPIVKWLLMTKSWNTKRTVWRRATTITTGCEWQAYAVRERNVRVRYIKRGNNKRKKRQRARALLLLLLLVLRLFIEIFQARPDRTISSPSLRRLLTRTRSQSRRRFVAVSVRFLCFLLREQNFVRCEEWAGRCAFELLKRKRYRI